MPAFSATPAADFSAALQEPGPRPDRRRAAECRPGADPGPRQRRQGAQAHADAGRHRLLLHAARLSRGHEREEGRQNLLYLGRLRCQGPARRPGVGRRDRRQAARAADPWSGVDSAAIRSLAAKIASQIVASLSGGGAAPPPVASEPPPAPGTAPSAAAKPPAACRRRPPARPRRPKAPGEVMALVAPVSGAPGDGQKSLTAAIKKRLYRQGR